jgi:hypothetical protein
MSQRTLYYSFKVWLTTVIVSPGLLWLFFFFYVLRDAREAVFGWGDIRDAFKMVLFGMAFCIPSLLLFWILTFYVCEGRRSAAFQRLLLILSAFPLILVTFIFVFMGFGNLDWPSVWFATGVYYLAIMGIILLAPLPAVDGEPETERA